MSKGYINNCIQSVSYALFQLQDKYICWPSQKAQYLKNLQNPEYAKFIGIVGKIDKIDTILHYKLGDELLDEYYFN